MTEHDLAAVNTPALVVSLDFELHWGVRDHAAPDGPYRENLMGVRRAVPAMLDAFADHGVRATWATVGALFATDRDELEHYWPEPRPRYANRTLDADVEPVGNSERDDPLHYAGSLIARIAQTPGQEIGSHTFTHYYCCERGQDETAFRADLASAAAIAKARGITLRSLVLPRNQVNVTYLDAIVDAGFTTYRGNQCGWMYRGSVTGESLVLRGGRLIDAYLPLSGDGSTAWPSATGGALPLTDIPASRFLRPWSRTLRSFEPVRLRRIKTAMRRAAEGNRIFHLWWHPHNFGVDLDENLSVLRALLTHFERLRDAYGMQSLSMGDIAIAAGAPGIRDTP